MARIRWLRPTLGRPAPTSRAPSSRALSRLRRCPAGSIWVLVSLVAVLAGCAGASPPGDGPAVGRPGASRPGSGPPVFRVVRGPDRLVVPPPGNRYGFEGGEVLRVDGIDNWFTTELTGAPFWGRTTLARWTSPDGRRWHRSAVLFGPSSADQSGLDRRAALWAPVPVFDPGDHHWRVFYVGYRSRPSSVNYDGEIWEARSRVGGIGGIGGPYEDLGVVLSEERGTRQSWEGPQGDDSFDPYRLANGSWRALFGSRAGRSVWRVGLASAPSVDGPWTRMTGNPLAVSSAIENPVVGRIDHRFIAVYDDLGAVGRIGCMWSSDGSRWRACRPIAAGDNVRTPLGMISAGRGRRAGLTLFSTARAGRLFDLYSEVVSLQVPEASHRPVRSEAGSAVRAPGAPMRGPAPGGA